MMTLFNNRLNVVLGKINQQNDFIAGPSYWAAIPDNNGVVPTGTEGYNDYPSSMWGAREGGDQPGSRHRRRRTAS